MLFLLIILSGFAVPAWALETGSKIHTGVATLGIGESYELYQGYSIRLIEPSTYGKKVIMEIELDGSTLDEDIFLNQGEVYQFTAEYQGDTYLILSITLVDVNNDDLVAELQVTQYLDPTRSSTGFFIIDEDQTLEPGVPVSLKQGYDLMIEDLKSDSVTMCLYKEGVMIKEEKMKTGDTFNFTVTSNGKEYTIITFDLRTIFNGENRQAVFIEHLYQFEEPISSIDNSYNVTVSVACKDGTTPIYDNKEILFTYILAGPSPFRSVTIIMDDTIIEEQNTTPPGTYSMPLSPMSAGNHKIKVMAITNQSILVSDETRFYVRRGSASDPMVSQANPVSALIVFAATIALVIIWAAIRRRRIVK